MIQLIGFRKCLLHKTQCQVCVEVLQKLRVPYNFSFSLFRQVRQLYIRGTVATYVVLRYEAGDYTRR
jgi:hypothetical protein